MRSQIDLKYYGIALLGIICFFLIFYAYTVISFSNSDVYDGLDYVEIEFNKDLWIKDKEERYLMSKNLIDSEVLIGLNNEKVVELLGEDYESYSENTISYYIGFVPSIAGLDPDVLELTFENGIVESVRQHGT